MYERGWLREGASGMATRNSPRLTERSRVFDEYYGIQSGMGALLQSALDQTVRGAWTDCVDDFNEHAIDFISSIRIARFFLLLLAVTSHVRDDGGRRFYVSFAGKDVAMKHVNSRA